MTIENKNLKEREIWNETRKSYFWKKNYHFLINNCYSFVSVKNNDNITIKQKNILRIFLELPLLILSQDVKKMTTHLINIIH